MNLENTHYTINRNILTIIQSKNRSKMADEEEEVVEMEMEELEEKPFQLERRSPRRTRSTDGGLTPVRRSPMRTRSSDGTLPSRRRTPMRSKSSDGTSSSGGPLLRRTRTGGAASSTLAAPPTTRRSKVMTTPPTRVGRLMEVQNEDDSEAAEEEVDMEDDDDTPAPAAAAAATVRPRRAPPRRTKSSDTGLAARIIPRRTKSSDRMEPPAPGRAPPKRNLSGFGRAPPRRTKSSDGSATGAGASTLLGMRRARKKMEKAGSSANSMNIFGSDMVSQDKVIEDIQKAADNPEICKLELEDFFMAERDAPEDAIPLALKDLLEGDDRPWESVVFVDDIMDGSVYSKFRSRKREFLKILGGVCATRLIPVSYKAKVTLSSASLSTTDEMVDLLQKFKSDKSITRLTIQSEDVDEIIITSLTELFSADKRKWESVTLQLSGGGPEQPGTPEHAAWCQRMQSATENMQQVCKDRGIHLG